MKILCQSRENNSTVCLKTDFRTRFPLIIFLMSSYRVEEQVTKPCFIRRKIDLRSIDLFSRKMSRVKDYLNQL